jgi:uncharacterized protein YgiM (DUF1202 family)
LRKGRCSNDPVKCTLAASRAELAYAGMDSVCPECGSPLAAIAITAQPGPASISPPPPPPPMVQPLPPVAIAPNYARQESSRFDERSTPAPEMRSGRYRDEDYDEPAPKDGFMKMTQLVIVGAAVALLGFFAWRMFLQPRPVTAPDLSAAASVTGVAGQQVTQISPAQLRRVIVVTQANGTPDAAGPIVAQLPVGSTLDVTGQIQVNGVNWLRVSLPNDSSKSGFVREDQMGAVGDGTLSVTPLDQLPGTLPPTSAIPGAAVPETVGPVQARAPSTFYIASRQANIRQEATVTSGKVGTFEFSDPITVIGERTVGGRTWYQVQLPSGGSGWINGRLVSAQPRAQAIDAVVPPATKPKVVTKPTSDGEISDISKADNQAALMAMGPGATLRVDSTIANLRKEPGATGNSVVETLSRDTLMSVEDVRILDGVPWYRVTSPQGAQGWISGRTVVENK